MARKSIKSSFSHRLLKTRAISGMVIVAASNPYFGLSLINGIGHDLKKKKWREFYKELYRLKTKKRLNVSQNNDGTYKVEVTSIGKNRVARYDLDNLQIKKPSSWDGGWRFFAFDIPTDKKNARQALLSKLKDLGFIMVQKSLWAHPFECREELAVISKAFEVESYVSSFVAWEVEGDWILRIKFQDKNKLNLSRLT